MSLETKNENIEVRIPFFNIVGKRKTKMEVRIPFFNIRRKTENENRSSNSIFHYRRKTENKIGSLNSAFPNRRKMVGALGYTHSVCPQAKNPVCKLKLRRVGWGSRRVWGGGGGDSLIMDCITGLHSILTKSQVRLRSERLLKIIAIAVQQLIKGSSLFDRHRRRNREFTEKQVFSVAYRCLDTCSSSIHRFKCLPFMDKM